MKIKKYFENIKKRSGFFELFVPKSGSTSLITESCYRSRSAFLLHLIKHNYLAVVFLTKDIYHLASLHSDCVTILKIVFVLIKSQYFQEEIGVFLKIVFRNVRCILISFRAFSTLQTVC